MDVDASRFSLHWAGLGPDLVVGLASHYLVELCMHMSDAWWCHHVVIMMRWWGVTMLGPAVADIVRLFVIDVRNAR